MLKLFAKFEGEPKELWGFFNNFEEVKAFIHGCCDGFDLTDNVFEVEYVKPGKKVDFC